jgi:hypothetical protein
MELQCAVQNYVDLRAVGSRNSVLLRKAVPSFVDTNFAKASA